MTVDEVRVVVESGGLAYAEDLIELFEAQHGWAAAEPLWNAWFAAFRAQNRLAGETPYF